MRQEKKFKNFFTRNYFLLLIKIAIQLNSTLFVINLRMRRLDEKKNIFIKNFRFEEVSIDELKKKKLYFFMPCNFYCSFFRLVELIQALNFICTYFAFAFVVSLLRFFSFFFIENITFKVKSWKHLSFFIST